MPSWEPSAKEALKQIAEGNPDLALRILSVAKRLEKRPTLGELALRPDCRYYTDQEHKFRISYLSSPRRQQIHITVIRVW